METLGCYHLTGSRFIHLTIGLLFTLALTPRSTHSVVLWTHNGRAVNTVASSQHTPVLATDGAGGAIVLWTDERDAQRNIYAQRVGFNGALLWNSTGVRVTTMEFRSEYPRVVSDGAGGVIAVYEQYFGNPFTPDHALYAQRLGADGSRLWGDSGIQIAPDVSFDYEAASDGAGGVIAVWRDVRNGNLDVYGQRLNAAGTALWTVNGLPVCNETSGQFTARVVPDGFGGSFVTWMDARPIPADPTAEVSIWAQRLDGSGQTLWAEDGVLVCDAPNNQTESVLVSDGADGVIIAWLDERVQIEESDVYAQRLSAQGSILWTSGGAPVCVAENGQIRVQVVSDDSGGAVFAWVDARESIDLDIFAQRLDPNGAPLWTLDGVPVCTLPYEQQHVRLVGDGSGGAFLAWEDMRAVFTTKFDIYAQHLSATGTPEWTANGQLLCNATNGQINPELIASGASAIVCWQDDRSPNANTPDIYAQKVGEAPTHVRSVPDLSRALHLSVAPNPFTSNTSIRFRSQRAGNATLEVFDVAGRVARALDLGSVDTTWQTVQWIGTDSRGNALPSGVYLYRVSVGGVSETGKMVIRR